MLRKRSKRHGYPKREVCDHFVTRHVGEPQGTHIVVVKYGVLPTGRENMDSRVVCIHCAIRDRDEMLAHGYEVDMRLINQKGGKIKQINNLTIKFNANEQRYYVCRPSGAPIEDFVTLMGAEEFCKETLDFTAMFIAFKASEQAAKSVQQKLF